MKHTTMKYVAVMVLVLAFAGVSAAQVTINPFVNMDFMSTGSYDADGEPGLTTTHTAISAGAEAVMDNGLQVYGKFSYGFGGDITELGTAWAVDKNTKYAVNAGVRYALFSQGAITVGPVVDYSASSWAIAEGNDTLTFRTNGIGAGLYATMDAGDVRVSASYIHRLSSNLQVTASGQPAHNETGAGNTLAVSGSYKLTDQVALTASYVVNNEFIVNEEGPTEGNKLASSGFGLGMRISF